MILGTAARYIAGASIVIAGLFLNSMLAITIGVIIMLLPYVVIAIVFLGMIIFQIIAIIIAIIFGIIAMILGLFS